MTSDWEREGDQETHRASRWVLLGLLMVALAAVLAVCGGMCWSGAYFTGMWDGA